MATPTIEKEFFFEYNHVQKLNITCEFVSEFELFIFRSDRSIDRSTDRPSEDPNQNVNFFESVSKIDVYVVLVLTNIIIGELNTKLYDSDNGIPTFCICENLAVFLFLVFWKEDKKSVFFFIFKMWKKSAAFGGFYKNIRNFGACGELY